MAQSLDRSVISSAGTVEEFGGLSLEWTLGEIAVHSYSHESGQVTEGFHQPLISVFPVMGRTGVTISNDNRFAVFPNPTSAKVLVRANLDQAEEVHLLLYDALGRQMLPINKISEQIDVTLDLEAYQAGAYLLIVRDHKDQVIHTTRILKH